MTLTKSVASYVEDEVDEVLGDHLTMMRDRPRLSTEGYRLG